MIWVIGDIHGMFDPLKRLITELQANHYRYNEQIEKLIFLGDYIDFGPSSKEVIDYIINLPIEKVFLMGNHDDLLLQFLYQSELFQDFGNVWFRGNGGQRTVNSFYPEKALRDHDESFDPSDFVLEEPYLSFFKQLKISHTETIGDYKFAFVHGMINSEFSINDQLALQTYDDFHQWRKKNKVWIEDTPLWNREEPKNKYDDHILIHGHLPTPNLDKMWKNLYGFDTNSALPFCKFVKSNDDHEQIVFEYDQYSCAYTSSMDQLIAINCDTGAVYGHKLTAIGLSEDLLSDSEIQVNQVAVNKGYRQAINVNSLKLKMLG